jgi:hypothetical protein
MGGNGDSAKRKRKILLAIALSIAFVCSLAVIGDMQEKAEQIHSEKLKSIGIPIDSEADSHEAESEAFFEYDASVNASAYANIDFESAKGQAVCREDSGFGMLT